MSRTPRRARLSGLLVSLTVLGVAVAGCSSSNDSASTDGPAAGPAPAAQRGDQDTGGQDTSGAATGDQATLDSLDANDLALSDGNLPGTSSQLRIPSVSPEQVTAKSVISTGSVALRSPDVAEARFDVQKVVDHYRGEVTEEQTDTDDDGTVKRSHLVVRIPTADFRDAMDDLEGAAELITSNTTSDDVTTEVIDVAVRLRVQRRSIARVETLLDRAQSIRDIIAIEAQLSRRQAVLNSLERRQSYLADQTAMSTVAVSLERTPEKAVVTPAKKKAESTGFVPGLKAGWSGLSHVAVGVATVAGALLPFLVVLLVLLVPGWPIARRWLRRRTPSAPLEA